MAEPGTMGEQQPPAGEEGTLGGVCACCTVTPRPGCPECLGTGHTQFTISAETPPRYLVERSEAQVQCCCPPALCTHWGGGQEGYRLVIQWVLWDSLKEVCVFPYDRRRDALAEAKRLEQHHKATLARYGKAS